MPNTKWFEVSVPGLAAIAKRRGIAFIITEPIQNAWDEASTRVKVTLETVAGKPQSDLTVEDDSPEGFQDITDSFMMFRQSKKLSDPEKRGRFNMGDKLILAAAVCGKVITTTGTIIFDQKGRRRSRQKTERGSILHARLRMTREEHAEALKFATQLIPPAGIQTFINGDLLPERTPLEVKEWSLETEVEGEEGGFKYVTRKTEVRVYKTIDGEEPQIYEMGIPVDTIDTPWSIEVMQKVPLSVDRGSVRFGYTTQLKRIAAEMMAAKMTKDESRGGWVATALPSIQDDEVVRKVIRKRFGPKAVTYDPSDPEANKRAMDAGYKVVHGGELDRGAWNSVRRAEALVPAGQKFSKIVETSPDGDPGGVERADWTAEMEAMAEYAALFGQHVLGVPVTVHFYDNPGIKERAFYGNRTIGFNLGKLGHHWVNEPDQETVDDLLIHEFAHEYAGDHLSEGFYRACTMIGAKSRSFDKKIQAGASIFEVFGS